MTYRRGRCSLKFHHYVEESPRFSPMITLGIHFGASIWWHWLGRKLSLHSRRLVPLAFNEVGLWYAIPSDAPESLYPTWYYSSRDEFKQVAQRLRDEVVDRWARPIWEDQDRLLELIHRRYEDYLEERRRDRSPPEPGKGFAILRQREEEIRRNL